MGIFDRLVKRSASNYITSWLAGYGVDDESVSVDDAIKLSAAFRCIMLLAENIASMPIHIYKPTDRGRERQRNLNINKLLNTAPNKYTTAMEFKQAIMWQVLLYGVGRAEILYSATGDPAELWVLPTSKTKKVINKKGEIVYEIDLHGTKEKTLPKEKIFEISWVSSDAVENIRPLQIFRRVFENAINTDKYSNNYFKNAGTASAVLTHKFGKDKAMLDAFKKDVKQAMTGSDNAHRIMFLQDGMQYQQISEPPNRGQMIETRKHNVLEICRLYNVQPHKVMEMENTIKSNIEQSSRDFIDTTLLPWAERWKQSIMRDLLNDDQIRQGYYAELNFDALLRGDTQTRYAVYKDAINNGIMSINEVRAKENLNMIDGDAGDVHFVSMALMNIDDSLSRGDDAVRSVEHDKEMRTEVRADTQRTKQAQAIAKLASRHEPAFYEAGNRIIKREADDIKKNAKKYLANGEIYAFIEWLESYFDDARTWVKSFIKNEALTLAGSVADLTSQLFDIEEMTIDELNNQVETYITNFSETNTGKRKNEIKKLVNENIDGDVKTIVTERLEEWKRTGGEKISSNETVYLSSLIARKMYQNGGYRKIVFINTSGNSCPFCTQLNGHVVGISEPIIPEGDSVVADDGSGLKIDGIKMHTPIHRGCKCQLVPE